MDKGGHYSIWKSKVGCKKVDHYYVQMKRGDG